MIGVVLLVCLARKQLSEYNDLLATKLARPVMHSLTLFFPSQPRLRRLSSVGRIQASNVFKKQVRLIEAARRYVPVTNG